MLQRRFAVVVGLAVCGCAPAATQPAAAPKAPLAAQLAVPKITSDEDFAAARSAYEALALASPERAPRRAALERWLLGQSVAALDGGHLEEAVDQFKQALALYDADELRAPPPDAPLAAAADRLERALRRRGQHEEVLTALSVEITLGSDAQARRRYAEVTGWLRSGGAPGPEGEWVGADGRERVIEDLESVARVWPSPFVVGELRALYLERPEGEIGVLSRRAPRRNDDPREVLQAARLGYELATLYLRVSRPEEAQAALHKLEGQPGDDPELRTALDKLLGPSARPVDAFNVAMQFLQRRRHDADVAERVCRDAERRFPQSPEPYLCVGRIARARERLGVAQASMEEALKLEPGLREAWELLARIYLQRLVMLVSDENLDVSGLEPQLRRVEAFYAEADKRFGDKPLQPSLATAIYEVGRGYFNGGRLAEATRYLERSVAMEAQPQTLEQLGQIRLKKGDGRGAAALFERATALPKPSKEEQLYWRAKLRRQLGDAFETLGDQPGAEAAWRAALADWDAVLGFNQLTDEGLTTAGIERAKLLYQLGERDEAFESFEKVIDALPDRGGTYAEVIAFLVPRGELEEALDAYHRALGRSEVTDYLKVYCSLWIVDLARRAGQPEDPLAAAYLKSTDGGKWYDDLARWATGREPEAQLMAHADTPARKAESAFYRAMRAFGDGRVAEARELWKQVLDTDMMAFFEYDMAAYYLKMGSAPSRPILKARPPRDRTQPPATGQRPPDGSI
jgi:tetratricopeptide (TPR) repeat protein